MRCKRLAILLGVTFLLSAMGCRTTSDTAGRFGVGQWGEVSNGLQCSLYVREHDPVASKPRDELMFQVRNVTAHPITIPIWNGTGKGTVPMIQVAVLEEPGVRTPPSFGDAEMVPHLLEPGAIFTSCVSAGPDAPFSLAYGHYSREKGSWVRFEPSDRIYHLKAVMDVEQHELVAEDGDKVKCWSGNLVSNTVEILLR